MPVDWENINSARDLVLTIDALVTLGHQGEDVAESVCRAFTLLEETQCKSLGDALAFIALSYRFTSIAIDEYREGRQPHPETLNAIDRYIVIGCDYINAQEGHRGSACFNEGATLH